MKVNIEKFKILCKAFANIKVLPTAKFRWYACNGNDAIYVYDDSTMCFKPQTCEMQ